MFFNEIHKKIFFKNKNLAMEKLLKKPSYTTHIHSFRI